MVFFKKILSGGYIDSRRTFGSLLNVKSYAITFTERFKAVCIDSTMVNKHIRSIFLLDKPKAFLVTEPLHSSFCHDIIPLSTKFQRCRLKDDSV